MQTPRARSASPSVRRYYASPGPDAAVGKERQLSVYEHQRDLLHRLESRRRLTSLKVRNESHKIETAASRGEDAKTAREETFQQEALDMEVRRTFARAKHDQYLLMSANPAHEAQVGNATSDTASGTGSAGGPPVHVPSPESIAARKRQAREAQAERTEQAKRQVHEAHEGRREHLGHSAKDWEYRVGVMHLYRDRNVQEARAQQFAALQRRKQAMQQRIKEMQGLEGERRRYFKEVDAQVKAAHEEKRYLRSKVVLHQRLAEKEAAAAKAKERELERKKQWARELHEGKKTAGRVDQVAARLRSKSAELMHSHSRYSVGSHTLRSEGGHGGIATTVYDRLLGGRSECLSAMADASRTVERSRSRSPAASPAAPLSDAGSDLGAFATTRYETAALQLRLSRNRRSLSPGATPSPLRPRASPFRPC